jgi:hypothetical protein
MALSVEHPADVPAVVLQRNAMDKHDIVVIDLHQLAAMMAQALESLECPDCCGQVHEFIDHGGTIYREEYEWACFVQTVVLRRR